MHKKEKELFISRELVAKEKKKHVALTATIEDIKSQISEATNERN